LFSKTDGAEVGQAFGLTGRVRVSCLINRVRLESLTYEGASMGRQAIGWLGLILGLWTPAWAAAPAKVRVVRTFSEQETDPACRPSQFLFSPEVVTDARDGTIRLAHSVLLADEMGATDWKQTQTLSGRKRAKKVFVLDSAQVTAAELFLFGSAQEISVNGKSPGKGETLKSTGWMRVKVPPSLLREGTNEFVLGGGGSLLIEPGRQPGRSFQSTDSGKTWSRQNLGDKGNLQGEYLVRLRLGRYAPRGWARSGVFDLWVKDAGGIAAPGKLDAIHGPDFVPGQAAGTIAVWLRLGNTPVPDEQHWTEWVSLEKPYRPAEAHRGHRWAQLRFELRTRRPQATPRIPARFQLAYEWEPLLGPTKDPLQLLSTNREPAVARTSVPFVYQPPSPRLKLLRERYQLDKVIAPGKTEMEQLMLLRHWVRNQWHTAWGTHPAAWMPPWDALMILSSKDQEDCLTMCTHYAAVFTQCCVALGWTARHCILDHHCTAEVWVDQHRKWVMMDAGNSAERADCTLHFERKGVPLSALELHLAEKSKQTQGITVHFTPAALMAKIAPLCRPAPASKVKPVARPDVVPIAELPRYPVCGLSNYRRYAFPARNNYLESLFPGELYQGWSEYFFDGYCWVGDSPDEPAISPEYSRHLTPTRPQDIDWSVNWSRIHLARTGKEGELLIQLEAGMPNLERLEMNQTLGSKAWKAAEGSFVWKLRPGRNVLRARVVNQFGRAGRESRVEVRWK
jgi:hypothetical protein